MVLVQFLDFVILENRVRDILSEGPILVDRFRYSVDYCPTEP